MRIPTRPTQTHLLDQAAEALTSERAAHEQTKAQLAKANGYWDGWMRDCTREQERREAAESALASARGLLEHAETVIECAEPHVQGVSVADDIDDWKQCYGTFLSSTPDPVAAPDSRDRCSCGSRVSSLADKVQAIADQVASLPVAAPCAGCDQLSAEVIRHCKTIDALHQAIDAAVEALDDPHSPRYNKQVALAVLALRAARSKP